MYTSHVTLWSAFFLLPIADKETTPTKDPLENEIGDASDLHDGEIAQPEAADPDETSL